jgi:hypothetical protein
MEFNSFNFFSRKNVLCLGWMAMLLLAGRALAAGDSRPRAESTADQIARNAVKMRSFLCGDSSKVRKGSATFVKTESFGVVLITSSHVLFHGDESQGICHEFLKNSKWTKAQLLEVNGALGVGVLTSAKDGAHGFDPNTAKGVEVDDKTIQKQDLLKVAGVPHRIESEDGLIIDEGKVVLSNSQRIILPRVSSAVELEGAHNEFGMSGGGVFSERGFVGILSHQYVAIKAGQPADTAVINDGVDADKLVSLVIKAGDIMAWLNNEVAAARGGFRESVSHQLRSELAFRFGTLQIIQRGCGADTGGIGGQGVGIGGEDQGENNPQVLNVPSKCHISVERLYDDHGESQQWTLTSLDSWFAGLNQKVGFDRPLTFYLMSSASERLAVRGLYHTLTRLTQGYTPLYDVADSSLPQSVITQINEALAAIEVLNAFATRPDAPFQAKSVLDYLKANLLLIKQGDSQKVDLAKLKSSIQVSPEGGVAAPYQDGWVFLYNESLTDCVELTRNIVLISDQIKQ